MGFYFCFDTKLLNMFAPVRHWSSVLYFTDWLYLVKTRQNLSRNIVSEISKMNCSSSRRHKNWTQEWQKSFFNFFIRAITHCIVYRDQTAGESDITKHSVTILDHSFCSSPSSRHFRPPKNVQRGNESLSSSLLFYSSLTLFRKKERRYQSGHTHRTGLDLGKAGRDTSVGPQAEPPDLCRAVSLGSCASNRSPFGFVITVPCCCRNAWVANMQPDTAARW